MERETSTIPTDPAAAERFRVMLKQFVRICAVIRALCILNLSTLTFRPNLDAAKSTLTRACAKRDDLRARVNGISMA